MNDQKEAGEAAKPLENTVVVELGNSVAAPFAGQILGDLGATVIKIEKPGGDDARQWGPPFWHGASVIFQSVNRNKYSAVVDLKNPEQVEVLRDFIATRADVVVQNMRAGLVRKLGVDESLRARNPRLVYCNLHAFGATGPYVNRPGYDPLMQAFGGIMSITGNEGEPPVRVGSSIIDQGAGMWCVIGILSALYRRQLTGEGMVIDTSLYETALSWVNTQCAGYQATGKAPGRLGSENSGLVPYRVFEASDGYLMIAAGNDNLFNRLAKALGRSEWLDDPRFSSNPARVENRSMVNGAVQDVIGTRTVEEWLAVIEPAGVPVAPLQTIDQVMAHPQTQELGMMQDAPGVPDGGMKIASVPLSFDGERPGFRTGPPGLGADTDLIFRPDKASAGAKRTE